MSRKINKKDLPSFKKCVLIPLELYQIQCEDAKRFEALKLESPKTTEGERLLKEDTLPTDIKMKLYDNWLASAKHRRDTRASSLTPQDSSAVKSDQPGEPQTAQVSSSTQTSPIAQAMNDKQSQAFEESDSEIIFKGFPRRRFSTSTPLTRKPDGLFFDPLHADSKTDDSKADDSKAPDFSVQSTLSDDDIYSAEENDGENFDEENSDGEYHEPARKRRRSADKKALDALSVVSTKRRKSTRRKAKEILDKKWHTFETAEKRRNTAATPARSRSLTDVGWISHH